MLWVPLFAQERLDLAGEWHCLADAGDKEQAIPAHTDGLWLEFPVIREDTNDGQLVLTTEALTGPNLMITEIAFIPKE